MKRIVVILLALMPMVGVPAMKAAQAEKTAKTEQATKAEKAEKANKGAKGIKADKQVVVLTCDLHCQGCCDKVMKNIAFEKGVKDLVCDLKTKTVTVTYDANKTDVPTLLKAFEKIGKPARVD